ncbi:hypothetical protein AAMO2058_000459000 [Amorphochlora amoebiformis]
MEGLPIDVRLRILGNVLKHQQNDLKNQGSSLKDSSQRSKSREKDAEQKSEGSANERAVCVVMSKDRAFQLQECLRSLIIFSSTTTEKGKPQGFHSIYVLCHVRERFKKSYERVRDRFPSVKFLYDTKPGDFSTNLLSLVQRHSNDLICFVVDDMVFFREFSVEEIVESLRNPKVLGYQLGLHPNVKYCHPRDAKSIPPTNMEKCGKESVCFRRILGTGDWNYPWNLCGGTYRGKHVILILNSISGTDNTKKAFDHPNNLEVNGNLAVAKIGLGEKHPLSTCPSQPVSSVVTVNRVQDIYKNRIYDLPKPQTQDIKKQDGSVESLDRLLWEGYQLELRAYKDAKPTSVHVGMLALERSSTCTSSTLIGRIVK